MLKQHLLDSPFSAYPVSIKGRVGTNDWEPFNKCLRNDQPVKGISVVKAYVYPVDISFCILSEIWKFIVKIFAHVNKSFGTSKANLYPRLTENAFPLVLIGWHQRIH